MPTGDRRSMNIVGLTGAAVFVSYDSGGKPNFSLAGGRTQSQNSFIDGGTAQNDQLQHPIPIAIDKLRTQIVRVTRGSHDHFESTALAVNGKNLFQVWSPRRIYPYYEMDFPSSQPREAKIVKTVDFLNLGIGGGVKSQSVE